MSDAPIKVNPEGGVTPANNPVERTAEYLPLALKAIEDKFGISITIIAIVGYIIIAAFGKMDSMKKYLGYIFFLAICLSIYKLTTTKMSKLIYSLIVAIFVLVTFILSEHGFFAWIKYRLN